MQMQIGDNMSNMLLFDKPAIADKLRSAGFCVVRQRINDNDCFAVEDCKEVRELLADMKRQFGKYQFVTSDKLYF